MCGTRVWAHLCRREGMWKPEADTLRCSERFSDLFACLFVFFFLRQDFSLDPELNARLWEGGRVSRGNLCFSVWKSGCHSPRACELRCASQRHGKSRVPGIAAVSSRRRKWWGWEASLLILSSFVSLAIWGREIKMKRNIYRKPERHKKT